MTNYCLSLMFLGFDEKQKLVTGIKNSNTDITDFDHECGVQHF